MRFVVLLRGYEMNKKEQKYQTVQEALILLTVITLLSFVCRLWALILLCILALIAATVRLLFLKAKSDNDRVEEQSRESTDKAIMHQDLYTMAYSLILDQITSLVDNEFEGAKWVWETQNPKKNIEHGEDVFIILNGAGGYRRAKVRIVALRAIGLEFQSVSEDNAKQEQKTLKMQNRKCKKKLR